MKRILSVLILIFTFNPVLMVWKGFTVDSIILADVMNLRGSVNPFHTFKTPLITGNEITFGAVFVLPIIKTAPNFSETDVILPEVRSGFT